MFPDVIQNNPVPFIKAAEAIVLAVLGLAVAFGLHVTPDQQTAILNFTGAVIIVALLFAVPTVKTTVPKNPTPTAPDSAIQVIAPPPAPPPAPAGPPTP